MRLGVNVDHVSTLREARGTFYPDPVEGALLAESAGCDSIVVHLREDRRHIKERDVICIKKRIKIPLNLEMSINKDIVEFARYIVPSRATLVPERRRELTTEGGINLIENYRKLRKPIEKLKEKGIKVSLFIDPVKKQIKVAKDLGADLIEINTGRYSEAKSPAALNKEIKKMKNAVAVAKKEGFSIAVGHGLDYDNVKEMIKMKEIEELNIGHSIICRSVFVGIMTAVKDMFDLIQEGGIAESKI